MNPPHLWAPLAMIVVAVGIRTRWIGSRTIVGLDDNEKKMMERRLNREGVEPIR